MKANASMRLLLEKYAISLADRIPENNAYPIWQKTDTAGRAYWGASSFWGMDQRPIPSGEDLSRLEWDGNEVHLDAQSVEETTEMLRQAVGIIAFWKKEMETKYPAIPFYIFASFDNGDMLILEEGELPARSVTLRFWADRGSNALLNLEDFENWEQPAIVEYCNFAP